MPHPFCDGALRGNLVTELPRLSDQTNAMRTIRVSKGLFVLRYVASKAGLNAPTLSVDTSPTSGVDLIWPNSGSAGRLVSPGDGLVVRAARDSFISVAVTPSHRNGSCDAELVLERVSTTIRQTDSLTAVSDFSSRMAEPAIDDIEILAHVARRGDVVMRAGQWICGPDLPMAIEGLEIRWRNRPQGVDIVSSATINARGLRTLAEQSIGAFQGTRGRAAPITSLTLSLRGPSSGDYLLNCEALFLGLPVMTVSGKSCVLRGATGLEPLVGLRLSIMSAAEHAAQRMVGAMRTEAEEAPEASAPTAAHVEKASRVRIFRSSRVKSPPAYSLAK
jgi:hypothetical protein